MNVLQLSARLIECGSLRYTPFGTPVVECMLAHSGEAVEANSVFKLEFSIPALAIGALSYSLLEYTLNQLILCTGFLAAKRRNSRSLIFHLTTIQKLPES